MASEKVGMLKETVGQLGAMGSESANMAIGTIFGLLQMAMQNRAYEDTKFAAGGLAEFVAGQGHPGARAARKMYNLSDAQEEQLDSEFSLNQPGPIPDANYPEYA